VPGEAPAEAAAGHLAPTDAAAPAQPPIDGAVETHR
jgi:hypothetical protein